MTVVEIVLAAILAQGHPFGPVPFTVTPYEENLAKIEIMTSPPKVVVVNSELQIIEVDGVKADTMHCKDHKEKQI